MSLALYAIVALSLQLHQPAVGASGAALRSELNVPFLAQTDALCGGAAIAMVFRYWGDAHADPRQFAALVDRRAGGIADDQLTNAIVERGWRAVRLEGSMATLEQQIAAGHPVVILIADRADRYHYIVVTGVYGDHVVVHDPSWGPSRRMASAELLRLWKPSGYWSLLVTPDVRVAPAAVPSRRDVRSSGFEDRCDRLLDEAVETLRGRDLSAADDVIGYVSRQCPGAAGPLRELAGVRFAQRQWSEAAHLADKAIQRDPTDAYAWDVLASSRFMSADFGGALAAWNHIGRPQIDLVRITGLRRQRFQAIADVLDLPTNALLTESRFARAERRLQEVPGIAASRITLQPAADDYVAVDIAVAEQAPLPRQPLAMAAMGLRATVDREIGLVTTGFSGQGEAWSLHWRWWSGRPRVALGFAAPRVGRLPGVWNVEATWEQQSYLVGPRELSSASITESHASGILSVSDWLTSNLRYSLAAGFDTWRNPAERRAVLVRGSLERHLLHDRLSAAFDQRVWMPAGGGDRTFHATSARIAFRSSTAMQGQVFLIDAGVDRVSDAAPLASWVGAGDGHRGSVLLRAHPLLDEGVVNATGDAVFGRSLLFSTVETNRWIASSLPIQFGVAAFADIAQASRRLNPFDPSPVHVDVGGGLRVHIPGYKGALRIDIAHGLHDGANAVSVGWQITSGVR